ncbi:response regulator [Aquibium sp. LZ166]|uniref:Response regulator n=1 Tax=Aquibium pacificus TaxID=3153579 RepID=A0ABV3SLX3_9HYPH
MSHDLAGKRIFVLEDEVLIAMEATEALERLGAVVVGPVHRLEKGLEIARTEAMDAAVLDVNLGGSYSYPVAEILRQRGIPLVFATGYGGALEEVADALVIDKPYSREQLGGALAKVLSGEGPAEPPAAMEPPGDISV